MKTFLTAIGLSGILLLSGCATYDQPYNSSYHSQDRNYNNANRYNQYERYGTVESVQYFTNQRGSVSPATGAVVGAVIGGVVGNQFGSGRGRTAATIGGAAVGGVVGDNVQRNNQGNSSRSDVEVRVRFNNGERMRIVQPDYGDRFYTGQQVRVVGEGRDARIYAN